DPRTPLDLVERGIRLVTAGEYDRRAISITQAAHLVQSQPDSHEPAVGPLESAVPAAVIDIDWPDLDAMSPSIAHDLSRRIEPHRLSAQQGRAECVRVVALHPGRGVGNEPKARGVACRKAIAAEARDLLERLLRKGAVVAAFDHPLDQLVTKVADRPGQLERGRGSAQQVSLARRKPSALDSDPHGLLLKQRHAERLLEYPA